MQIGHDPTNPPSELPSGSGGQNAQLTSGRFSCHSWKLDDILGASPSFAPVHRVSALTTTPEAILSIIKDHERQGHPLIVSDLHKMDGWDQELLSPEWLVQNCAKTETAVRDVHSRKDTTWAIGDYLQYAASVSPSVVPEELNRFYAKDAPCPEAWMSWLENVVPASTLQYGSDDMLAHLNPLDRPETLMCYLGVGDTYTPSHKDNCASSGQNLMTYTSSPDTSAFWFFTPSSASLTIAEYFHDTLHTELDFESKVLSIEQWAAAPCKVFVCEQKLGDLVLVPSKSCHQVMNKGGLSIKTSWSRMTVDNVIDAVKEECVIYRRVCRSEVYRTKLTVYCALKAHKESFERMGPSDRSNIQTLIDISKLIPTFDEILQAEWCPPKSKVARYALPEDICCDFCGADIFQSFFECTGCNPPSSAATDENEEQPDAMAIEEEKDYYHLCATCYVEGRSCSCGNMTPYQHYDFNDLLAVRNHVAVEYHLRLDRALGKSRPAELPILTEEHLQTSRTNRVFQAACHLAQIRSSGLGQVISRCSPTRRDAAHDVIAECNGRCQGCHRGFCYPHSLWYRRAHSSDELAEVGGPGNGLIGSPNQAAIDTYHERHIKMKDGLRDAGKTIVGLPWLDVNPLRETPRTVETLNDKEQFDAIFGSKFGESFISILRVAKVASPSKRALNKGKAKATPSIQDYVPKEDLFDGVYVDQDNETNGPSSSVPPSLSTAPHHEKVPVIKSLNELRPSLRLVWAATTFQVCRPVNTNRSAVGWYDHPRVRAIMSGADCCPLVEDAPPMDVDKIESGRGDSSHNVATGSSKKRQRHSLPSARARLTLSQTKPKTPRGPPGKSLKDNDSPIEEENEEYAPARHKPHLKASKRQKIASSSTSGSSVDVSLSHLAQSQLASLPAGTAVSLERSVALGLRPRGQPAIDDGQAQQAHENSGSDDELSLRPGSEAQGVETGTRHNLLSPAVKSHSTQQRPEPVPQDVGKVNGLAGISPQHPPEPDVVTPDREEAFLSLVAALASERMGIIGSTESLRKRTDRKLRNLARQLGIPDMGNQVDAAGVPNPQARRPTPTYSSASSVGTHDDRPRQSDNPQEQRSSDLLQTPPISQHLSHHVTDTHARQGTTTPKTPRTNPNRGPGTQMNSPPSSKGSPKKFLFPSWHTQKRDNI